VGLSAYDKHGIISCTLSLSWAERFEVNNTEVVGVLRNARFNVLNAVASAVALNLINPFIGIYAVKLGADNLQLGYLSSWPQAVSIVAILGAAAAVAKSQSKQRLIAGIFLLGRAAALGASTVPWFPERARVWALIGFWMLAVFPQSAAGTAQQSFLADVFPGSERARAFAARTSWASGVGTAVMLAAGWLLDYVFPYPYGYQIVFAVSFVVALVEIFFFLQMKPAGDHAADRRQDPVRFRTYLGTLSHQPFRQFLSASIPFHFIWMMAWPIFTRYQVTELGANNTWTSYINVAATIAIVVSAPRWARGAERYGSMLMMGFAAINMGTAPFLLAAGADLKLQVILHLWTGIGLAGVQLLILNNLLDVSPAQGRPVYLAVHAALVAVAATVAPLVGAFLMDVMPTRLALALCGIPRLLAAIPFFILAAKARSGKGIGHAAENHSSPKPVV